MIKLPEGKVCRNLPEQVAENLKKIQEIIQFLDGVNIQDNLVVIADLSQILTAEELEVVELPVAFIYYNSELYIKKNEAAGVAYFVNILFIEDTGTQLNFNNNEIQVNLGTGALTYTTVAASSYTKSQIDADVAKLSGADFIGAITGPSIIENMSGYSFTKAAAAANRTYTYKYVSVCKNGNKITFVLNGLVNTLSSISGGSFIPLGTFDIPAEIGNKLIPYTVGTYDNIVVDAGMTCKDASLQLYDNAVACRYVIQKISDTQISFALITGSFSANKSYIFRIETTFLLGEDLAA